MSIDCSKPPNKINNDKELGFKSIKGPTYIMLAKWIMQGFSSRFSKDDYRPEQILWQKKAKMIHLWPLRSDSITFSQKIFPWDTEQEVSLTRRQQILQDNSSLTSAVSHLLIR